MAKKDHDFWSSAVLNNQTYLHYLNLLKEIAISRFKWNGLPDSVDTRFLEMTTFEKTYSLCFADEVLGLLVLPCTLGGKLDVYNIPIRRRAYSNQGYQKRRTNKNSVIIFDNLLHESIMDSLRLFAYRLYKADRVIDTNVNAQKTPLLITCDESEKLTFINLYKNYDGNAPVTFGYKGIKPDSIKAITTQAPFVSDKVYELKVKIWNEALTFLGISNVSYNKKERMVSDEVVRNQGGTLIARTTALRSRQIAADQINKMFGKIFDFECSVEFYEEDLNVSKYLDTLQINNAEVFGDV